MAAPMQANTPRGRGRPKKVALSPAPAPAASETPRKRGRPAKAHAHEPAVEEAPAPTKRGRGLPAATAAATATTAAKDSAATPKKRGRPSNAATTAPEDTAATTKDAAVAPKKRGRPAKPTAAATATTTKDTAAVPKRRGRPANTASTGNLNRVAGSPRVSKRAAPRINPRIRSKLRTRLPPAQKATHKEQVPHPAKKRGRPAKAAIQAAPKKTVARKPTAKAAAPRKRRGYTALEIPDKFAAQVQHFIQQLYEADTSDAAPSEDEVQLDRPTKDNASLPSASGSNEQEQDNATPVSAAEHSPGETGHNDEDWEGHVRDKLPHSTTALDIQPGAQEENGQNGDEEDVFLHTVAVEYDVEVEASPFTSALLNQNPDSALQHDARPSATSIFA